MRAVARAVPGRYTGRRAHGRPGDGRAILALRGLTRLFGATGPGMTFACSSPGPALTPQQALQLPAPPPPPLPLVPLEATDSMLELPHPLLQQTEDQFLSPTLPCSSPLISFSPPLDQDDYLWGLDGGEGISDLFDSYDLGDLLIN